MINNKKIAKELIKMSRQLVSGDMNRNVYEGWTPQNFIDELEPSFKRIMQGNSIKKPFNSKEDVKEWLRDNQPYYKKNIPEVINYFIKKFKIK